MNVAYSGKILLVMLIKSTHLSPTGGKITKACVLPICLISVFVISVTGKNPAQALLVTGMLCFGK